MSAESSTARNYTSARAGKRKKEYTLKEPPERGKSESVGGAVPKENRKAGCAIAGIVYPVREAIPTTGKEVKKKSLSEKERQLHGVDRRGEREKEGQKQVRALPLFFARPPFKI